MASSKERQRKLAQAKAMRQMARRTEKARRNRRIKAAVTAVVVVAMVGLVGAWAGGAFEPAPKPAAQCAWTPTDDTTLEDVGRPPTRGIPTSGTKTMTIAMGQGTVEATIDLAKVPCTAASLTYLAGKKFYDNTKCHRLTTGDLAALQCGDPSTKDSTDLSTAGKGGPTYTFADENLPAAPPASAPASASASTSAEPSASATASPVSYARGTVAMAGKDQLPDQNGSQFYIFFKDSKLTQKLTVVGTVTKGLDVIDGIAKAGVADKDGQPQTDGQPKTEVKITSLTMSGVTPAPTAPQPAASTSSQPSGAASAQGSAASSSGSQQP